MRETYVAAAEKLGAKVWPTNRALAPWDLAGICKGVKFTVDTAAKYVDARITKDRVLRLFVRDADELAISLRVIILGETR
jgi:hypothetical protein